MQNQDANTHGAFQEYLIFIEFKHMGYLKIVEFRLIFVPRQKPQELTHFQSRQ